MDKFEKIRLIDLVLKNLFNTGQKHGGKACLGCAALVGSPESEDVRRGAATAVGCLLKALDIDPAKLASTEALRHRMVVEPKPSFEIWCFSTCMDEGDILRAVAEVMAEQTGETPVYAEASF